MECNKQEWHQVVATGCGQAFRYAGGLAAFYCPSAGREKIESYVFLELCRRVEHLKEIAIETPAFAVYKGGEIDFYVKSLEENEKTYAVEVKSGKQGASTVEDGKVDYLLLLKGNTKGGNAGKVLLQFRFFCSLD